MRTYRWPYVLHTTLSIASLSFLLSIYASNLNILFCDLIFRTSERKKLEEKKTSKHDKSNRKNVQICVSCAFDMIFDIEINEHIYRFLFVFCYPNLVCPSFNFITIVWHIQPLADNQTEKMNMIQAKAIELKEKNVEFLLGLYGQRVEDKNILLCISHQSFAHLDNNRRTRQSLDRSAWVYI